MRGRVFTGALLLVAGALTASAVASRSSNAAAPEREAKEDSEARLREAEAVAKAPLLVERYLDALIERHEAAPRALLADPEFLRAAALLRDQLLAQAYVERHRAELLRDAEVTEAELRAAYERKRSEYVAAPTFTAHHLLVYRENNPAFPEKGRAPEEARARVEAARRRLLGGESWDSVARELSDDLGTRERGGSIRESRWGLLPPAVEDVMRSVELGVPSPVIESPFGYHLVQVESRSLEPMPLPFERVREGLLEQLSSERQLQNGRRFLAPLYETTKLTRTEVGRSEAHLSARGVITPEAILATVGERKVSEAELQAFVQGTVPASQRTLAFARPHARQSMLTSYLDVIVLSEMARRGGLEEEPAFQETFRGALDELFESFARHG